jgi:hypothetical protein
VFDRLISVDWSGAGTDTDQVDLRVAMFDSQRPGAEILAPPGKRRESKSWSRREFASWILDQLQDPRPALIAMDFGFGLPWGSDKKIFGVDGWRDMLRQIASLYRLAGSARAMAQTVNSDSLFGGHGPYRFNDGRNDFRFYFDHEVPYYRLTELIAPQGISQWYLGSGGTVGFHTITGLSAINELIDARNDQIVNFQVWPHESLEPVGDSHIFVESYPAICACPGDYGPCKQNDQNQKDAWKVLQSLMCLRRQNMLDRAFRIKEQPFGRITSVDFVTQVQFEGYIFGIA